MSRKEKTSARDHLDRVPDPRIGGAGLAGRELHNGKPSKRSRDSAGRNVRTHLQYTAITRHKEDVDRKPHRKRVNEVGRRDDHRLTRREAVPPQEPLSAVG